MPRAPIHLWGRIHMRKVPNARASGTIRKEQCKLGYPMRIQVDTAGHSTARLKSPNSRNCAVFGINQHSQLRSY